MQTDATRCSSTSLEILPCLLLKQTNTDADDTLDLPRQGRTTVEDIAQYHVCTYSQEQWKI